MSEDWRVWYQVYFDDNGKVIHFYQMGVDFKPKSPVDWRDGIMIISLKAHSKAAGLHFARKKFTEITGVEYVR